MASELGDVAISVGESFVRMTAVALCLLELAYLIAEVGRQERHSRLEVLRSGAAGSYACCPAAVWSRLSTSRGSMTEPYSCGLKWPRTLSATFHTNATLSLKPSGAAMTQPPSMRVSALVTRLDHAP